MPAPAGCEQGLNFRIYASGSLGHILRVQNAGMEVAVYDPRPTEPPPDVGPKISLCIYPQPCWYRNNLWRQSQICWNHTWSCMRSLPSENIKLNVADRHVDSWIKPDCGLDVFYGVDGFYDFPDSQLQMNACRFPAACWLFSLPTATAVGCHWTALGWLCSRCCGWRCWLLTSLPGSFVRPFCAGESQFKRHCLRWPHHKATSLTSTRTCWSYPRSIIFFTCPVQI